MSNLNDLVTKWSALENGSEFIAINDLLEFLGNNLYHDYEPTTGAFPDYYSRLRKWIHNVTIERDQQNLLRLAKKIFYVGREEFAALYRSAYNNIIARWIFDQENIDLYDESAYQKLQIALNGAWFCPVTDSMRINQFYHINQVSAKHEFRPDWRSLKKFGDIEKIKSYTIANGIKYIILLEDFVGSAKQSNGAVKFACQISEDIKVLFVPLIIYNKGFENIQKVTSGFQNFTMSPVMLIGQDGLISKDLTPSEDAIISDFRKIIEGSEPMHKGFKYGYEDMGCLLVMYTNTPNNSLPLIYYEDKGKWSPLFNRHNRSKQ